MDRSAAARVVSGTELSDGPERGNVRRGAAGDTTGSVDEAAKAHPIVKWAGGKRQLVPALRALLPAGWEQRRLVEPFAGGAALFFGSSTPRAALSDRNVRLIATYTGVRDFVEDVLLRLAELARCSDEAGYYEVRDRFNALCSEDVVEVAACFLYLNRTCFNGLYRENARGAFNVPWGRRLGPMAVDAIGLRSASARLRCAKLGAMTFEDALEEVRASDVVYLDPPYAPRSATSRFSSYVAGGFDDAAQVRLRNAFRGLTARGVQALMSNSDTPRVRELYAGWPVVRVNARRSVGATVDSRGVVGELVISTYG